jgi:hypothetical protein
MSKMNSENVNKPGKTILVKLVSNTTDQQKTFNKLEGLVSCAETKTYNSYFLTFDTIVNATKAYATLSEESKKYNIKFSCDGDSVYSREVVFGESDGIEEEEKHSKEVTQEFDTEQLTRIAKIAGLSSNMQIYQAEDCALLFKSGVGSLGKISIYVKSKREIEEDEKNNISNDDE